MKLAERLKPKFSQANLQKGQDYAEENRVDFAELTNSNAKACVEGTSDDHTVQLQWSTELKRIEYACSCSKFSVGSPCQHVWATVLRVDEIQDVQNSMSDLGVSLESVMDAVSNGWDGGPLPEDVFEEETDSWRGRLQSIQESKSNLNRNDSSAVVTKQTTAWYVLSVSESIEGSDLCLQIFSRDIKKNGDYAKAKQVPLGYRSFSHFSDRQDRELLELLSNYNSYSNLQGWNDRNIVRIPQYLTDVVLPKICQTGRFAWRLDRNVDLDDATTFCWDGDSPWDFQLEFEEAANANCWRISAAFCRKEEVRPADDMLMTLESGWIFFPDSVGRLRTPVDALPWVNEIGQGEIEVPFDDRAEFLERFASISPPDAVELPESLEVKQVTGNPVGHFSLVAPPPGAVNVRTPKSFVRISFDYGEINFGLGEGARSKFDIESDQLVFRDIAKENELYSQLPLSYFESLDQYDSTADYSMSLVETVTVVTELLAKGWIVDSQGVRVKQAGQFNVHITSDIDWFNVTASLDFDGTEVQLPDLLKAVKRGDQFIRLGDGSNGILPEEWLRRQQRLLGLAELDGDSVRFRSSQAMLLDALLAEKDNVQADRLFNDYRERLNRLNGVQPGSEPDGFCGTLREYQKDGIGWFSFLQEFGFGGCLADDMGLGKTIQVLALLQNRKNESIGKRLPSIVVVPKSLVFNWEDEAARFCPGLKVANYTGFDRAAIFESGIDFDVVVTTYGTLRRDIVALQERQFDYVILDEAQNIKNHSSLASKACRLLNGNFRLAMTGTPIENHIGELWALFEFLNPGMLGSSTAFQTLSKDAKKPDDEALRILSRAMKPFILRRTKSQVLSDLPEKTENTLVCELDDKQRKYYDDLREYYRAHLKNEIKQNGLNKSKFHVLEALLRLRQAACHPGLIDKSKQTEMSAKQEMLLEQIENVIDEGHKALVFSQFTSLLSIFRMQFDSLGIRYEYLDGKTRKRAEIVKRFQENPESQLFLISLKAGGHGLNLTAADYVFILDPWWNPAVEAQAIDRAHRIGQTKPVFAYRLICRDTVEEKIMALQKDKRDLADAIIGASDNLMRRLSAEDLQLLLS